MYDTYIIEARKGAAGIVVRDGHGFRFFAATQDFYGLEGQVFGSPKEARNRSTPAHRQRQEAAEGAAWR